MRHRAMVLFGLATLLFGIVGVAHASELTTVNSSVASMPLAFTANQGQWPDSILFRADAGGAVRWFTRDGVYYQFTRRIESSDVGQDPRDSDMFGSDVKTAGVLTYEDKVGRNPPRADGFDADADSVEFMVVKATFVGASPNPEIVAEGLLDYKCNYFLGNDPDRWRTDVPNFSAITFKEIYPGIDLKYTGDGNGQAAYEFIAAPDADIAQIKVSYDGAEETSIDADGRMIVRTKWGDIVGAIGSQVRGTGLASPQLSLNSENAYGFQAANQSLDQSKSLALQLYYSTYLGGGGEEEGHGIAVDDHGTAYVTGYTKSSNFPIKDAYDSTYSAGYDVFVTKLSSSGALIYSTYVGGGDDDYGNDIAVNGSGNACVTGSTHSTDFPTQNAYDASYNGGYYDVFVTQLSSAGNSLIYSTYLGGGSADWGFGIAIDFGGNAYLTGGTASNNFPTQSPYQMDQGSYDVFVSKLSSAGNSLIYSTYLGGGEADEGFGIAVSSSGYAYVTGYTESSDFPTENPYQTDQGNCDAFVTKFSCSGDSLMYSTYLGGGSNDFGWGIARASDGGGMAIVTGETYSSDFPTRNPYQMDRQGLCDAFVTKLGSSGNSLIYSTYLGGGDTDFGNGIAVDGSGKAYVTGGTWSSNFPTNNPYQTDQGNTDAFGTCLSSSGNSLIYSTYLGGSGPDAGYGIAVDDSSNAYVTGYTYSSNFPTMSPYQTDQGGNDVFVTRLSYGFGDLAYRPDPDGWQFANGSANMWPQSWWQQFDYSRLVYPLSWRFMCSPSDFPDWHLFVRAFGVDQCYYDPDPGHPIYKPSATSRWFDIKQEYGGTCTGFAISSFLFFDGFLDVATEFPGNTEVYQVPISDESRLLVNMYWVYQFGEIRRAHQNANMLTTTPTQTLQACQEMFQSAVRNDRVLYMGNNNGHGGHSVNPYRFAVDPVDPDVYYIYIYDNNSPGNETRRVSINTLTDTWSYDAKPTWGGARRLFLSNPMSDFTTNPILSRSRVSQDKLISGIERSASQYAEFYLPSTGDVVFRYSSDSIGLVGGSSLSTLTDGIPIIPETGQETPPIGYYLPNRPWNVRLSGFTDSTLRLTAYLDSTVIAYSRNDVDSTQIDELKYRGNDSSVVVVNPDIVSHVYSLQVISIHPDSEVVVKIAGLASEAGDSNYFSITSESGLRIDNYGAPSEYSIRVEIASPVTDTVFFHDGVIVGGNSSHVIVPDWRQNNDSLIVQVDSGMTGAFSDTLELVNEGEPPLYVCGDVDGSGAEPIDISDLLYLIDYMFQGGPEPSIHEAADVADCNGMIDISDLVYFIDFMFIGGPDPCAECGKR